VSLELVFVGLDLEYDKSEDSASMFPQF
jgi:hypothetical protein